MKELMKSKFVLTLSALVLLTAALAIPLSGKAVHDASANVSSYPANIEHDQTGYGLYEQSNLTNPNISGVGVNMNWAAVEPQQGTFNWAPLDKEIAAWATDSKKFVLVIRYASNGKRTSCTQSSQFLPQWEIPRIPTFCTSVHNILPDYFNSTFQSDLLGYVSAIAQHIGASPYKNNLEYERIGVGVEGEGYPCTSCSASDMKQLTAWGYSISNWAAWQKQMLTAFQSIFSPVTSAPLIYALGDNDIDPTTNQPVSQEVGYWAAANGIGVGQEGLHNTSNYQNGETVRIATYIRTHYPSAYIQFQTDHQITGTSSGTTEVQGDITIASSAGAFTIEWYGPDTVNPSFQPYFQQWQQWVDCTYGGNNCPPPSSK